VTTLMKCPVEALNKGLKLLEYIAKSPDGIGLTKLAERMNLKVTTTHNLVKTLHICGYVNKMDDGKYQVGWKLPSLTRPAMIQLDPEGPAVQALKNFAQSAKSVIVCGLHHTDSMIEVGGEKSPHIMETHEYQMVMNRYLDYISLQMRRSHQRHCH
jgi:DNA-binding IclR family transcriptional regulator